MNLTERFQVGDRVAHPRRPEWGSGLVVKADTITHEGQEAQRLRVDFANKRNAVINTAIAPLTRSGDKGTMAPKGVNEDMSMTRTGTQNAGGGWLDDLEGAAGGSKNKNLWDLPYTLDDPFSSMEQQLDATLETFKYSTEPGPLFQWAVVQTGLDDPLTQHTRVELEQAFPRYARDRDNRLFELVRQFKRRGAHAYLAQTAKACKYPAGRAMLEKAIRA
ncbi:MAG: DUF3553 domain-containing protein [Planctomycetota bacterium]